MNEKLSDALSCVDDRYVARAARKPKRGWKIVISAVAAIMALVLVVKIPGLPLAISAQAVALAPQSRRVERPTKKSPEWKPWYDEEMRRQAQVEAIQPAIADFSAACAREFFSQTEGENRLWSPVSAYLALAMTAELTGGSTRQMLLNTLGASDCESLRQDMSALWEQISVDDGKESSVLAASVWLDDTLRYEQSVMDQLAGSYYASVYQGSLGSEKTNRDVGRWIHNETHGALGTPPVSMPQNSVLSLVSTLYFQSKWAEPFSRRQNTQAVFHSTGGDRDCTYMNTRETKTDYYWGEDFGAISLRLENGSLMWLILPDEDKTVTDVLDRGEYAALFGNSWNEKQSKYMKVNLSLPKFDISSQADLKIALKNLGLQPLFEPFGNDFSPSIISTEPTYLDNISQQTRVQIDEQGVVAASYIEFDFGAGAAAPPEEIMDFILDRPFLFAITKNGVPLFMGTVEAP